MFTRFSWLKVASILLCAVVLNACDGGDGSGTQQPAPAILTVSGPTTAQAGDTIVLSAELDRAVLGVRYLWVQTAGEPLDWTQYNDRIGITAPGVSEDSTFAFEVFAISDNLVSSYASHSFSVTSAQKPSAIGAATVAFSKTTQLLQFGNLVRNVVIDDHLKIGETTAPCVNGGLLVTTFLDNDTSGNLSQDDVVTVDFSECVIEPFERVLSGRVTMTLNEVSLDPQHWKLSADISNVLVEGDVDYQIDSVLDVDISKAGATRTLSIATASAKIYIDGAFTHELSDFLISRVENLTNAIYSITASTGITDTASGSSYAFDVEEPFLGYFNEFPHEGKATIALSESEVISLASNFVNNSEFLNISSEQNETEYWDRLTSNVFWSIGKSYGGAVKHRSDNFEFIGEADPVDTNNAPLDVEFSFVFSRPVADALGVTKFRTDDFPYTEVPAVVSIEGALVKIKPEGPLEPGRGYTLEQLEVSGPFGSSGYTSSKSFVASNAIVPIITTSTSFYRYGDTPLLSAENSILNEGEVISYQWTEVTNKGVVFETPTEATTTITLPPEIEGDIIIELTASNELGNRANAQATLVQLPTEQTFMAFESEVGDYIGAGQTQLFTSQDGEISSGSTTETPNQITLNFNGEDFWTLNLASPSDESLAVGKYIGATRFPFQSPTAPGLTFSGSGRGCNKSYGEFDVLELEYDEFGELLKLAVNFTQHCESPTAPALRGIVRFNSIGTLN